LKRRSPKQWGREKEESESGFGREGSIGQYRRQNSKAGIKKEAKLQRQGLGQKKAPPEFLKKKVSAQWTSV